MSVGLNVHYLGILPTPGLMYYSKIKKAIGVIITASHNPYFYNGIKVVVNGRKLSESEELKIEKSIENSVDFKDEVGRLFHEENACKEYINHLLCNVDNHSFNICVDCANGATFMVAQEVFNRLNNKTKFYSITPDGININKEVGSTNIEFIKEKVLENKSDFGIAFDGDGDRVIFVDSKGNIIDGDKLIYIIASYLKEKERLNYDTVVLSMMGDLGVIKALENLGITTIETKVGDKYIYEKLVNMDLSIGGENSGHIILENNSYIGDGLYTALLVIKILKESNKTFDDYLLDIPNYMYLSCNLPIKRKYEILKNIKIQHKISEIREKLENDCKLIVRPSGTEDILRVNMMCKEREYESYFRDLVELIKEVDNNE